MMKVNKILNKINNYINQDVADANKVTLCLLLVSLQIVLSVVIIILIP